MTLATLANYATLSDTEARAFLSQRHVGRIAFSRNDRVDIEPISYTMDGDWIFGRTGAGTKLCALAHHPWCAFETDESSGMFEWTSVVVKGTFYLLDPESGSPDTYLRALACIRALEPMAFSAADSAPHRGIMFGIFVNEISACSASLDAEKSRSNYSLGAGWTASRSHSTHASKPSERIARASAECRLPASSAAAITCAVAASHGSDASAATRTGSDSIASA
jgi:nitroimidazol reductase NimA-like FMN-containing flavoprotein (pyridoxamine 5'-phosphate oxidase superfamily)